MPRYVATVTTHLVSNAENLEDFRKEVGSFRDWMDAQSEEEDSVIEEVCSHIMDIEELTEDRQGFVKQGKNEEAIKLWNTRVFSQSKTLDPDNNIDWGDMAFGFFLACGYTPEESKNLTKEISDLKLL